MRPAEPDECDNKLVGIIGQAHYCTRPLEHRGWHRDGSGAEWRGPTAFTVPDREKLIWAAVDLDGTLAESVWPEVGVGPPIKSGVVKVRELHRQGWKIIVHTSRSYEAYELIEAWLWANKVPFSRIVCGKVLAAVYIDDRAKHSDEADWSPR